MKRDDTGGCEAERHPNHGMVTDLYSAPRGQSLCHLTPSGSRVGGGYGVDCSLDMQDNFGAGNPAGEEPQPRAGDRESLGLGLGPGLGLGLCCAVRYLPSPGDLACQSNPVDLDTVVDVDRRAAASRRTTVRLWSGMCGRRGSWAARRGKRCLHLGSAWMDRETLHRCLSAQVRGGRGRTGAGVYGGRDGTERSSTTVLPVPYPARVQDCFTSKSAGAASRGRHGTPATSPQTGGQSAHLDKQPRSRKADIAAPAYLPLMGVKGRGSSDKLRKELHIGLRQERKGAGQSAAISRHATGRASQTTRASFRRVIPNMHMPHRVSARRRLCTELWHRPRSACEQMSRGGREGTRRRLGDLPPARAHPPGRINIDPLRADWRGVGIDSNGNEAAPHPLHPPEQVSKGILASHVRMCLAASCRSDRNGPGPVTPSPSDASGGRLQLPKLRRPQGGCFYGACLALLLRQLPKPEGRLDPRSEVYPAGLLAGQAPERMLKPCERSLNDPGRDSAPVWGLPGLATKQWLELEIDVGTESAPIPTRAGRPVPHATPTSPDKYQCRVWLPRSPWSYTSPCLISSHLILILILITYAHLIFVHTQLVQEPTLFGFQVRGREGAPGACLVAYVYGRVPGASPAPHQSGRPSFADPPSPCFHVMGIHPVADPQPGILSFVQPKVGTVACRPRACLVGRPESHSMVASQELLLGDDASQGTSLACDLRSWCRGGIFYSVLWKQSRKILDEALWVRDDPADA
ncbi:unnamed protein product [Diplocarpon coronariae]